MVDLDNTVLPADVLRREQASLRDLIEGRLDAMDKATEILSENVNRVPTLLDREINRLTQLQDERFSSMKERVAERFEGISTRFLERDRKADAERIASSTAITAALAALKELIAQRDATDAIATAATRANTTKQIDSIETLLNSNTTSLSDKISVINGRLDRGEGGGSAVREARADAHMTVGSVVGIVGGVTGGLTLLVLLVSLAIHQPTTPLVGADTRRVDDLITQTQQRSAETNARLDALSARLNATNPPQVVAPGPSR